MTNDIPYSLEAPCGSTAYFDEGSGIGYRCGTCSAIIGSIGMPRACRELIDMDDVISRLKKGKNEKSSNALQKYQSLLVG